jgi:hypothetical protein
MQSSDPQRQRVHEARTRHGAEKMKDFGDNRHFTAQSDVFRLNSFISHNTML